MTIRPNSAIMAIYPNRPIYFSSAIQFENQPLLSYLAEKSAIWQQRGQCSGGAHNIGIYAAEGVEARDLIS